MPLRLLQILGDQFNLYYERRQVQPADLHPCGRGEGPTIKLLPDVLVPDERVEVRCVHILLDDIGKRQSVCLERLVQPLIDRANRLGHITLPSSAGNTEGIAIAERLAKADVIFHWFICVKALRWTGPI